MTQTLITAVIVVVAFAYVARRYLPRAWFRRERAIPLALVPATGGGCGSGCNACDTCPVAVTSGTRRSAASRSAR